MWPENGETADVLSKAENYRIWDAGGLGNRLQTWRTLEAYQRSSFQGRVTLRYLGGAVGAWCTYDLWPYEVEREIKRWEAQGADRSLVMVNESAPDDAIVLQGELLNAPPDPGGEDRWLWLRYCRRPVKMRMAMANGPVEEARGLRTILILKWAMRPSSWSDFEALLERYSDHVLEFSVYSCCLGDRPGRNTLVWEARRY